MGKERIILKLSGAALHEEGNNNILSPNKLSSLAHQIKQLHKKYDIAIVIGGGNIWRGGTANIKFKHEDQAHYMGMVATLINSIALNDVLISNGVKSEVHSLLPCPNVAITYNKKITNKALLDHKIVILAGGTGKPFFSTDTGASQNAVDLGAKLIIMAKDGVDGVYSSDPKIDKKAKRYSHLTYDEAITKKLKFMDLSALKMCRKYLIKILVFNMERKDAIINAINKKIPITIVEA